MQGAMHNIGIGPLKVSDLRTQGEDLNMREELDFNGLHGNDDIFDTDVDDRTEAMLSDNVSLDLNVLDETLEDLQSREASTSDNTTIASIEDIFTHVLESLTRHSEPSIRLKCRPTAVTKKHDRDLFRTLSFPGKTAVEAWKFGQMSSSLSLNQGH